MSSSSTALGQRAKFLTLLDNQAAEELIPMFSIDIFLGKSPQKKVKCGAITVFKLNNIDLGLKERYDFTKVDPRAQAEIEESIKKANEQTEVMYQDPIHFKETEGRWIQWAIDKALEVYDQVGGSARITIKCPRLKIQMRRSSGEVARLRSNTRELFPVAWDIDRLLDGDFAFDPWSRKIRRGRIDAKMSKR